MRSRRSGSSLCAGDSTASIQGPAVMRQLLLTACLLLSVQLSHGAPAPACADSRSDPALRATEFPEASRPASDYYDVAVKCASPRLPTPPDSAWLAAERTQYRQALTRSKPTVLVVPTQVQGFGFDRVERALMTADFARALSPDYRVADTALTSRALGETSRRIADAPALAARLGATKLIETYAGHDNAGSMLLTIRV